MYGSAITGPAVHGKTIAGTANCTNYVVGEGVAAVTLPLSPVSRPVSACSDLDEVILEYGNAPKLNRNMSDTLGISNKGKEGCGQHEGTC